MIATRPTHKIPDTPRDPVSGDLDPVVADKILLLRT